MTIYTSYHVYKKSDNNEIMYNKTKRNLGTSNTSEEYISIGDKSKQININNGKKKITYEKTDKKEFKQLMKDNHISKIRKKIKKMEQTITSSSEKTNSPSDKIRNTKKNTKKKKLQQKITDIFPKQSTDTSWNKSIQQYTDNDSEDEIDNYYDNSENYESIQLKEITQDLRFDEGIPYTKDDFFDFYGGYDEWDIAMPAYNYGEFPYITDIMKFFINFWDDEQEFTFLNHNRLYRNISL